MKNSKIALFLDYENFHYYNVGIERVLTILDKKGDLRIKKAYADWAQFGNAKQKMVRNTIKTIELPQYKEKKKNSCDIRLVIDAMEVGLTSDYHYIDTIALISCDSDFIPLITRLRELNKRVIVFAQQKSTNRVLKKYCDELILLSPSPPKYRSKKPALSLLKKATKKLQIANKALSSSHLAQTMRDIDKTFRLTDYGFIKFTQLLEYAAKAGIIRLKKQKDGRYIIISLLKNSPSEKDLLSPEAKMNRILRREFNSCFLGKKTHRAILDITHQIIRTSNEPIPRTQLTEAIIEAFPNLQLSKNKVGKVLNLLFRMDILQFIKREAQPSYAAFFSDLENILSMYERHDAFIEKIARQHGFPISHLEKEKLFISPRSPLQNVA